ncbi:F-box protein At3g07870-like [Telopea speciosissima]|uniref:F-box protein At3g07870-like n=1 Tax=Telopea speciosissima TaxID=54955 RepID=UPI001CC4372E|nr:F-box protein At3g07870-like [Telopea speciosissima]
MSAGKELENLPNEIKDKIFLSLPMMILLKSRCVIRDYTRFHNPHFMKTHLNQQIEMDNGSTIIVTTASKIYKVNIDKFNSRIRLDFPFRNPTCTSPIILVSSCNGLLCLTHRGFYGEIMYLWNPATGDYKQLPEHVNDGILYIRALGFGYDRISGKFKVLVISQRIPIQSEATVTVYTVGTSSWRSIGEVQYPVLELKQPQLFRGCPHWIVHSLKSIVSFGIGNEKFKKIPMPPIDNSMTKRTNLTALGGVLSIFCHLFKPDRFEMWLRADDGSENTTWFKGFSLNESYIPRDYFADGYAIKLYGFKDGQFLLRNNGPALFDPLTRAVRGLRLRGEPKEFDVYSYVESLAMVTVEETGDVHQNS